jgi:hypothetical protein
MKKIWKYLNGNKTIICTIAIAAIQKAIILEIIPETNGIDYLLWVLAVLGTGSLASHISKQVTKK